MNRVASHLYGNGTKTAVINHTDITYQIKEVEDALNAIDDPRYQFILHDYIIIEKRFTRNEACQHLSISVSKFNYLKNQALREFKMLYG